MAVLPVPWENETNEQKPVSTDTGPLPVPWESVEEDRARLESEAAKEDSIFRRAVADPAVSLVGKGLLGAAEAGVGLANMATGGLVGKGVNKLQELAGYEPGSADRYLESLLSKRQQLANRKVADADGFVETVKTSLENPSTIAHSVLESLPSMYAGGRIIGGLVGKGISKVAPKVAQKLGPQGLGIVGGAVGEGAVSAGQSAEEIRSQSPDRELTAKGAASAIGSGLMVGGLGAISGRIAKQLKIGDPDTWLASGVKQETKKKFLRRVAESAIQEGIIEELPQSAVEQIMQNVALNKPWQEGVAKAAAQGWLSGMAMGGGMAALTSKTVPAEEVEADTSTETPDIQQQVAQQPPPTQPPTGVMQPPPKRTLDEALESASMGEDPGVTADDLIQSLKEDAADLPGIDDIIGEDPRIAPDVPEIIENRRAIQDAQGGFEREAAQVTPEFEQQMRQNREAAGQRMQETGGVADWTDFLSKQEELRKASLPEVEAMERTSTEPRGQRVSPVRGVERNVATEPVVEPEGAVVEPKQIEHDKNDESRYFGSKVKIAEKKTGSGKVTREAMDGSVVRTMKSNNGETLVEVKPDGVDSTFRIPVSDVSVSEFVDNKKEPVEPVEPSQPAQEPEFKRKTVTEIADEIAATGADPQASYGQYVKAMNLKPEISAKEWLPIYKKSLELAKLSEPKSEVTPNAEEGKTETEAVLNVEPSDVPSVQTDTQPSEGAAVAREPWEMTLDEYLDSEKSLLQKRYPDADPKAIDDTVKSHKQKWYDSLDKRAYEGRIPDNVLDDHSNRHGVRETMRAFRGQQEKGISGWLPPDVRNQPVEPEREKDVLDKYAWERTWDEQRKLEFAGVNRKVSPKEYREAKKKHKADIQKAIWKGKTIPPSVLADYPELAKTAPVPKPEVATTTTSQTEDDFPSLEDLNSGKYTRDHYIKKLDKWVDMGTRGGKSPMNAKWERDAVKRFKESELGDLLKGKHVGSMAVAKIAAIKAETFNDLRKAINKIYKEEDIATTTTSQPQQEAQTATPTPVQEVTTEKGVDANEIVGRENLGDSEYEYKIIKVPKDQRHAPQLKYTAMMRRVGGSTWESAGFGSKTTIDAAIDKLVENMVYQNRDFQPYNPEIQGKVDSVRKARDDKRAKDEADAKAERDRAEAERAEKAKNEDAIKAALKEAKFKKKDIAVTMVRPGGEEFEETISLLSVGDYGYRKVEKPYQKNKPTYEIFHIPTRRSITVLKTVAEAKELVYRFSPVDGHTEIDEDFAEALKGLHDDFLKRLPIKTDRPAKGDKKPADKVESSTTKQGKTQPYMLTKDDFVKNDKDYLVGDQYRVTVGGRTYTEIPIHRHKDGSVVLDIFGEKTFKPDQYEKINSPDKRTAAHRRSVFDAVISGDLSAEEYARLHEKDYGPLEKFAPSAIEPDQPSIVPNKKSNLSLEIGEHFRSYEGKSFADFEVMPDGSVVIHDVWTAPEERNTGKATKLVGDIVAKHKGATIWTAAASPGMDKVAQKHGFELYRKKGKKRPLVPASVDYGDTNVWVLPGEDYDPDADVDFKALSGNKPAVEGESQQSTKSDTEILDAIKNQPYAKDWRFIQNGDGTTMVLVSPRNAFTLKLNDEIELAKGSFEKAYGKKADPDDVIAGKFQKSTKTITLRRDTFGNVVFTHEFEHFIEGIGVLTPKEISLLRDKIKFMVRDGKWKTLNRKDIGGSEDRAQFIAEAIEGRREVTGLWPKIVQRIKDFMDWIRNAMGSRTVEGVIRDIESGKVGKRIPGKLSGKEVSPQVVHHGTPHVWPPEPGFPYGRPRLDKIGTGEGAQAYGWGWYSAESEGVGESYRDLTFANRTNRGELVWKDFSEKYPKAADAFAEDIGGNSNTSLSNHALGIELENFYRSGGNHRMVEEDTKAMLEQAAVDGYVLPPKTEGSLYKLDIPDNVIPKLLDWDKPLSEQTEYVKKRLLNDQIVQNVIKKWEGIRAGLQAKLPKKEFSRKPGDIGGLNLYGELAKELGGERMLGPAGMQYGPVKYSDEKAASEYLASIGIPGNKYLDGMSRGKGDGSYNYVIWDQGVLDRIALLERNQEKLQDMQYSFVGQKAETVGNASEAEKMEADGESPEAIWEKTGWWRSYDGKWRYEVDDTKVQFNKGFADNVFENRLGITQPVEVPLKDAIDYPELFNAYKSLNDVKLRYVNNGEYGGEFDPKTNTIEIRSGFLDRSILIHELQHFIQGHEGFAQGGSPASEYPDALMSAAANTTTTEDVRSIADKESQRRYMMLLGEAESRATEKRFGMTPSQRKAEPPWVTLENMLREEGLLKEGQKPEDVLIVRDGGGVAASVGMDQTETTEFKKWFGKSKVVDENGKPLVVYHGTHHPIDRFKKTRGAHFGFHFGDQEAANERLVDTAEGRINKEDVSALEARSEALYKELRSFEEELRKKGRESDISMAEIVKKLEQGIDIDEILAPYRYKPTAEEELKLKRLQQNYENSKLPVFKLGEGANIGAYYLSINRPLKMRDVGNWGSVKNIKKHLPWDSDAKSMSDLKDEIRKRGYDGIVYKNTVENPIMQTNSYIAFEPTQIKSAIGNRGTFDPDDPDIRYSVATKKAATGADPVKLNRLIRMMPKAIRESLYNELRKAEDEAAKVIPSKDESLFSKWFKTPMFKKSPQMQLAFQAATKWVDNKVRLFNHMITDTATNTPLNKAINDLKEKNPAEFQKVKDLLIQRDRDGVGYTVDSVKKDGTVKYIAVPPPGVERTEVEFFDAPYEAWNAAREYEAEDYVNSGGTKAGGEAIKNFRSINDNVLFILQQGMRRLIEEYERKGIEMPDIVTYDESGEKVKIDLKQALADMESAKGYYFPRLRQMGRLQLIGVKKDKDGKVVGEFSKYYDVGFKNESGSVVKGLANKGIGALAKLAKIETLHNKKAELEADGYDVVIKSSEKLPESVFLDAAGKQMALGQILEEALKDVGKNVSKTLKDLGMYTKWVDGDFILEDLSLSIEGVRAVMEEFGGEFSMKTRYAKGETRVSPTWIFKNAPKDIEARLTKEVFKVLNIKAGMELAFTETIVESLANVIRSHGARSRMIKRSDHYWQGFETDPAIAVTRNAQSVAGGEAKRQLAADLMNIANGTLTPYETFKEGYPDKEEKEIRELYAQYRNDNRIDPAAQKELWDDYQSYYKDLLRNEESWDRIVGNIKGLAVLKYLAFRVAAPAANLTAMVTTVPASMNAHAGIGFKRGAFLLGKSMKEYGKFLAKTNEHSQKIFGKDLGNVDPELRRVFELIRTAGWDKAQYNYEAVAVLRSKMGQGWDKVIDWGMAMFGISEQMNRAATIAATYMGLKEQLGNKKLTEFDEDELLEKAKEVSDKAHGIYNKSNTPMFVRGSGVGANVARSAYLFQNFAHNYLLNLADIGLEKKNYRAAAYMLLSPMLVGGLGASVATTPALGIVNAILSVLGLGSDDPEEEIYKFVEANAGGGAANVARYGIPGVAGVSLKGSVQIGTPEFPDSLVKLFGAPGAMIEEAVTGAREMYEGNVWKGAEKMAPNALASVSRGVREYTEGVTKESNAPLFWGNKPLKLSFHEAVTRALSFNPSTVAEKREKLWSEDKIKKKYSDKKNVILDKWRKHYLQPVDKRSEDDLYSLMAEVLEFNKLLMSRNVNPALVKPITKDSIKTSLKRAFKPSVRERSRAVTLQELATEEESE